MDVPCALSRLAEGTGGLVTRRQATAAGVASRTITALVRSGAIARVARGVYSVGAGTADAQLISVSWQVVVSYESAAAWYGVDLPEPVRRLHVTAPRSRGRWSDAVPGIRLHRAALRRGDVVVVRGVRVTSPLRTAIDIARHASIDYAVTVIDSFLRAGHFTFQELTVAASRAMGPGRLRIQTAVKLADPASGSVLESLARVLLWRNNLPAPTSQYPFRARAGWVGYVDFAWPEIRVILECDGYDFHAAREPFQKDRRRWSAISRAGWRLGVVTWFDVTRDPAYVVALVRDLMTLADPPLRRTEQNTNVATDAA